MKWKRVWIIDYLLIHRFCTLCNVHFSSPAAVKPSGNPARVSELWRRATAAIFITHQHVTHNFLCFLFSNYYCRVMSCCVTLSFVRNHTWLWIPLKLNSDHIGKYMSEKIWAEKSFRVEFPSRFSRRRNENVNERNRVKWCRHQHTKKPKP